MGSTGADPAGLREVVVEVTDADVRAVRDDGERSDLAPLRRDGVDDDLLRVFDRWLTGHPRGWQAGDLSAFGSLLFRGLLAGAPWNLVQRTLDALGPGDPLRLRLAFPPTAAGRQLAARPWEYLFVPDRPGATGWFLAAEERVVLSRSITVQGGPVAAAAAPMRVLVVVAQPEGQAKVLPEPVIDVMTALDPAVVSHAVMTDPPTARALDRWLRDVRPDVVHVVAHGDHDPVAGGGRIALVDVVQRPDWRTGQEIAQIIAGAGAQPRLVVLQACLAGKEDPLVSFAGVAPQLVRHGIPAVVSMQYAVTPDVASAFTQELYAGLAAGRPVDVAAQIARGVIGGQLSSYRDPRLLGLPVVHARHRGRVLDPLVPPAQGGLAGDLGPMEPAGAGEVSVGER